MNALLYLYECTYMGLRFQENVCYPLNWSLQRVEKAIFKRAMKIIKRQAGACLWGGHGDEIRILGNEPLPTHPILRSYRENFPNAIDA